MIADTTPEVDALLAPVRALLDDALARLPWWAPVRVALDELPEAWALRGDTLVLSRALLGPDVVVGADVAHGPWGLDRWRRALASVLEGVAARGLPEDLPEGAAPWVRQGLLVHVAHEALPEAGIALPERAHARRTGDLARAPRAGEAVLAALAADGEDAVAWAREALATGRVGSRALVAAAARIFADEPALAGWVGVERVAPRDVPTSLGPWQLARLEVPAHPRGGRVRVEGAGGVSPAWAPADTVLRGVAAANAGGCTLVPDLGGPVGLWEVRSARGFGQFFGARGLRFRFGGGGAFEVELADAFVGGVADLEAAEAVGTSGTASGRWAVAGPHLVRLHGVRARPMTVHGRDHDPFVVPTAGGGMGSWIEAMQDAPWRWSVAEGRLTLVGRLFGGEVEIRLAEVG